MSILNNLFSIFDPSSYYYSSRWLIIIAIPIIFLANHKKISLKNQVFIKNTFILLKKEFSQRITKKNHSALKIIKNLLIIIFLINFLSLIQWNFTPTAHLSISFFLSLTYWISLMVWGVKNNLKNTLAHLTPLGTPNTLINFIVVIELIRNIIRPVTLAVRLSANIIAGHLLISLLSRFSINYTVVSFLILLILITLEIRVALIQAYVITTLISLYYRESYN